MTFRIDPAYDALYAQYYILGANMLAGSPRVIFDAGPFGSFKHTNDYLPMVIETSQGDHRNIIIDFGDTPTFRKELYAWADVYAKVNLTPETHQTHEKMMPIGPANFGIRFYPKWLLPWMAIHRYLSAAGRIPSAADFFASYKASLRRLTLDRYQDDLKPRHDYIHFVSTLWQGDRIANNFRVNFMEAVRLVPGLNFEGGFVPRADGQTLGYDAYIGPDVEPMETYRQKIGHSFVVFNTPAVKKCHGWKLPEFLAWGKAIISTPPLRMLPEPLEDGVHWLLTDGTVDHMVACIQRLQDEPELHASLQINARDYFERLLRPDAVMRRIIERAGLSVK